MRVIRLSQSVFLQDNYVVTDGIFIDERIVFDDVTDDWKQFCTDVLRFEIPQLDEARPVQEEQLQGDMASAEPPPDDIGTVV